MNLAALLALRAALLDELQKIQAKLQAENRALATVDEAKRIDEINTQLVEADKQIELCKRTQEALKSAVAAQAAADSAAAAASTAIAPGAAATAGADPQTRAQRVDVTGNPGAEKPFKNFGEQMQAIIRSARSGHADERLLRVHKIEAEQRSASGLSENIDADGGYLVQKDFSDVLLKRTYDTSLLAKYCTKIPLSAMSNGVKIPGIDETSRVDGSRYGGVQGYWANEADQFTSSKPKFRMIELSVHKLHCLGYLTDELIQDATALQAFLMQVFSEEIGFKLDSAIVSGSGAGQPMGFTKSQAVITITKESGQATNTLQIQNLAKMRARMWARSRKNLLWLYNQDIEPALLTLSLTIGNAGVAVYMPAGGISGNPYDTLYGRPMIPIEQAASFSSQGDISAVDLSQYLLCDKGAPEANSSVHVRFLYDEMALKLTYRVDGQPAWHSVLTPFNGSNTQSPFIQMGAR